VARGLADDEGVDDEADQGGIARRVHGSAGGGLRDADVAGRVSHHDESVGGGEMEEAVF